MKSKNKYEAVPFDKFLDEQLGKKGTKKRARADREMDRIALLLQARDLINKALALK